MAVSTVERVEQWLPVTVGDLTGALGDSVTVLPLVVALGALTPASLAHVLVGFGVFQVVWGLRYGLPLSVEPMKALAGLAIAGALTYGELVAAGLLAGGVLVVVGATGTLSRLQTVVGRPVIRGVQFAVALLLARAGLDLALGDPGVAAVGAALAGVVAVAGYRRAAALVVLAAGTVWTAVAAGVPAPALPAPSLFPTGGPALTVGAVEGTLAQLAMTVGNAAVATSLLCADLFDRDVSPDRLARSMGGMSLAAVPLGGLPMCHGSGGLAGKYAFGARSGTANVVLGVCYLAGALVAGLWLSFPMALLGTLLGVVAVQLGGVALDTDHLPLVGAIGLLAVATNVGIAFLAGLGYWLARERWLA
ncbi:putative sulfate/molybdate transporter [Halorientalis pallida]|uniref:Sulfate transporter n=1 Tax=Halorientalis pallida TaxID=2479928 RepID=A0A498L4B9_9EURY|nr:putative sulfate/molybdate transporter [Halorientalis pallida]RXK50077.1 sulfate transporter [Halorientalis pallida]